MKVLYDKFNKREARIRWFTDEIGDVWIDVDPMGVDMGGMIRIRPLLKNDQYEIREVKPTN